MIAMCDSRIPNPVLGLVIPLYNEEEVLPQLLDTLRELDLGIPLSILFVDDGSKDRTLEMLRSACEVDSRMACLSFSRNFGHQTAVSAGLQYVRGDIVAVLDGDLQDPPTLLRDFTDKWREGFDVVYGIRRNRKEPWMLRASYKAFYWLLNKMSKTGIPRDAGDFALMDRRVVDTINAMPEHNRFVRGLRSWAGFRQVGVPYERPARQAGKTSYNTRRLVRLALDGLLSFSSIPLRVSSWSGAIAALIGFIYLLYILVVYIAGRTLPPGWASLIVIVLFLGGLQLVVLGIIGEYLGRIFDEVKRRPHFVAQTTLGWLENVKC